MIEFGAKLALKDNMIAVIQKNVQKQKEFQKEVDATREALQRASETTVINWEKGISSPEVDLGLKLSLLYKIPLEYMDFTKDGNKDRRKKA